MAKLAKYRAARPVRILGGTVELTAEQARRRSGQIKATKKAGVFEVVEAVTFKAGEVFGYDGDVPKSSADDLVEATSDEARDAAEADARAAKGRLERARLAAGKKDTSASGSAAGGDSGAPAGTGSPPPPPPPPPPAS